MLHTYLEDAGKMNTHNEPWQILTKTLYLLRKDITRDVSTQNKIAWKLQKHEDSKSLHFRMVGSVLVPMIWTDIKGMEAQQNVPTEQADHSQTVFMKFEKVKLL